MAKRWTIPFVSKGGQECKIDIYDPDYSGSVIELSVNNANAPGVPAADPFYFEEDDDEDLLKVVRTKTGYINLIETVQDGLADIYPSTMRNRYVEVFYGGTLSSFIVFRGYIQQQTFENDWQAVPREVSLPVISVLGLSQYGEFQPELSFADKKLGYYMKKIIDFVQQPSLWDGSRYLYVEFPDNNYDFSATVRPTIATEENTDFSQAWGATNNPYKGTSFYDFLEGICNAYGWICHDLPDRILFTKYDHDGNYAKYFIGNLENAADKTLSDISGNEVETLDSMALCSDDTTISEIAAVRSVVKRYDGETSSSVKVDFSHERAYLPYYTYLHNNEKEYMLMLCSTGQYPDVTGNYLINNNRITNWVFDTDGINILDKNGTMMLILQNMIGWATQGNELFSLNFYKRPLYKDDGLSGSDNKLKLKFKCGWGSDVTNLGNNFIYSYNYLFSVKLYCGDTLIESQSFSVGYDDYEKTITFDNAVPNNNALRVEFIYGNDPSYRDYKLFCFQDIILEYEQAVYKKYVFDNTDQTFIGDIYGGYENPEVKMLMSAERINSNMIGTTKRNSFTTYGYLRNNQTRLQVKMRGSELYLSNFIWYMRKLQYWKTNWRWRLVALAFHPWDDEWQLTMHRSSTIE